MLFACIEKNNDRSTPGLVEYGTVAGKPLQARVVWLTFLIT